MGDLVVGALMGLMGPLWEEVLSKTQYAVMLGSAHMGMTLQ